MLFETEISGPAQSTSKANIQKQFEKAPFISRFEASQKVNYKSSRFLNFILDLYEIPFIFPS
jgi:hypothetical protein